MQGFVEVVGFVLFALLEVKGPWAFTEVRGHCALLARAWAWLSHGP